MSNVLDQAQNFSGGPVAAARKRDSWALKEANATDEGKRRLYREAIFDLEERYPDLHEVPVGGAEKFARERGHGSKSRSPVHEGRRRARGGSGGAPAKPAPPNPRSKTKPARKPTRARKSSSSPSRGGRTRSAPSPTPRVDRAISRTGIPQAVDSGGNTVLAALGATVGLGLGYLVLVTAGRPGAGSTRIGRLLSQRIPKAFGSFLNPYKDVFSQSAPVGGGASSPNFAGEEGGVPAYETPGFEKPRPGESLKQWGRRHQAEQRRRHEKELRRKGQGGIHR